MMETYVAMAGDENLKVQVRASRADGQGPSSMLHERSQALLHKRGGTVRTVCTGG